MRTHPGTADDAVVAKFEAHLLAERNASKLTAKVYVQDIAQFAALGGGWSARLRSSGPRPRRRMRARS